MKYRLFVSSTLSAAIFKIYVEELKKISGGMYFFGMLNLSSTYRKGKYGSRMNWLKENLCKYLQEGKVIKWNKIVKKM